MKYNEEISFKGSVKKIWNIIFEFIIDDHGFKRSKSASYYRQI